MDLMRQQDIISMVGIVITVLETDRLAQHLLCLRQMLSVLHNGRLHRHITSLIIIVPKVELDTQTHHNKRLPPVFNWHLRAVEHHNNLRMHFQVGIVSIRLTMGLPLLGHHLVGLIITWPAT